MEKKASGRKSHKCEETFATYSLNYCDFLNRATVSALQKAKEVYRTFHLYRANAMKILSFHRIFRKKMWVNQRYCRRIILSSHARPSIEFHLTIQSSDGIKLSFFLSIPVVWALWKPLTKHNLARTGVISKWNPLFDRVDGRGYRERIRERDFLPDMTPPRFPTSFLQQ